MDKKNGELESIFSGSIFAQPFRSIFWSQYWVVPPVEFQAALESRHMTSHGNMGKTKTLILKRWNTYFERNGNSEQRLKKNDWSQNHRGTFPSRTGEQIRLISWNQVEMLKLLFCFVNRELKTRKYSDVLSRLKTKQLQQWKEKSK